MKDTKHYDINELFITMLKQQIAIDEILIKQLKDEIRQLSNTDDRQREEIARLREENRKLKEKPKSLI